MIEPTQKGSAGSGFLILLVLLGIFAWTSRKQIRNVFAGVTPPSKDGVAGEWVGVVNITDGYEQYLGNRPGKHNRAVLRFKLSVYDSVLTWYDGPGEITIEGEEAPRAYRIVTFHVNRDGSIGGEAAGDWGPDDRGKDQRGHTIDGRFTPGTMQFSQASIDGVAFNGSLHKGTDADYQALCRTLR